MGNKSREYSKGGEELVGSMFCPEHRNNCESDDISLN